MTNDELHRWQGIAFSCFLAAFCALAIAKVAAAETGIIYWLLFIIASGLVIDPTVFSSKKQLLFFCALPGFCLILVYITLPLLGLLFGGVFDRTYTIRLIVLLFFIFAITLPALFLGSLARSPIIEIFTTDLDEIEKIEKILKAIGGIMGAILAAVAFFQK